MKEHVCVTMAGFVFVAGCASVPSASGPRASVPRASVTTGTPGTRAASELESLRKILVIIDENHSVQQVFPAGMPYLWSLARHYGYASDWSDVGHPSLPNYLAIFSGSAFNDPRDCTPAPGCTYPGPTVFGQALALGESVKMFEESMPRACDQGFSGEYDVNHNPWAYFPAEAASCRSGDVAAGTTEAGVLASDARDGSLPTVGFITPNLIHDGHDGTLAQADAWLRSWVPVLMSGPDWRTGKLAIVVVFDEGETTEQVPFVLMAPGISGVRVSAPASQYALTRLIDEFIGAPPLRQARGAPDLAPLFGLGG